MWRRGTRGKSEVIYNSNNKVLFSVPIASEKVRMPFSDHGIETNYSRTLQSIDLDRRIATFMTPDGPTAQEAEMLGPVLSDLREVARYRVIAAFAKSMNTDSLAMLMELGSDSPEEFQQLIAAQNTQIKKSIGPFCLLAYYSQFNEDKLAAC